MQSVWWLYALTYIFGYVTCKTFYFYRETRTGLIMLRLSHYLSLFTVVKGIESMEYAKTLRIKEMVNTSQSEKNIKAFKINFDNELKLYKDKYIREVINTHPKFYKDIVKYDSWDSAMVFLQDGGMEYIKQFTNKRGV